MKQQWYVLLGWWLCDKLGHIGARGWIYNGHYHRHCKLCGRIISEPLRDDRE